MNTDIQNISKRTRRYWYIDGLAEIFTGMIFLILGIIFLWSHGMRGQPAAFLPLLGLPVLFLVAGRLLRKTVQALKTRLTYPHTGYLAYRQPSLRQRQLSLLTGLGITAILIALMSTLGRGLDTWMPLIDGLLLGLILLWIGAGLIRFYALAAASVAIGALLSLNQVGGILGHAAFYGLAGLALLLSGTAALLVYLWETRNSLDEGGLE